jgi:hypothetical protein
VRKFAVMIAAAVVADVAGLGVTPAEAGANRTFVSANGSDSNPCTNLLPCRTFQTAVAATNAGGEILALTPGEYGTVTIAKTISLVNDGVGAVMISSATNGHSAITIAAGSTDVVNLRGLTLRGAGGGDGGVSLTSGGTLNIQNCVIRGFSNTGISFAPTTSATLTILDTIVSNNAGTGAAILLSPNGTGLAVNAYLRRVQVIGNGGHGIDANGANMGTGSSGTLKVTVVDSVSTGNGQSGVLLPIFSGNVTATVVNTRLTNNSTGATAVTGTIYLAKTTISGNTTGFSQTSSGTINSFGDNRITDTSNVGSLSAVIPQ